MLRLREEHTQWPGPPGWRLRLRETQIHRWETLRSDGDQQRHHLSDRATYILDDALHFLASTPPSSLHAIVTDPPYGLEYEEKDHDKLRTGKGGVWRIPPSFDGATRKPLPRFTVLSHRDIAKLHSFFVEF